MTNRMRYRIGPPPASPAARFIAALATVALLAAALVFGFFVLLVALGAIALAGLYAWVRIRWLRHAARRGSAASRTRASGGREIEGEYTVVSRRRD